MFRFHNVTVVVGGGSVSQQKFVPAAFLQAATCPPKPRRFRILNGLLYFFPEYKEIFPSTEPRYSIRTCGRSLFFSS